MLSLIGPPLTAAAEQIGSPFLVADLNQGPKPNPSSSPGSFAAVGSTLYFAAKTAAAGAELWKSDGTDAGTVMVKDIRPGTQDSSPALLTNVGGTLFFLANDGSTGRELWKSDGTEAGTVRVRDINPGAGDAFGLISPAAFLAVNGMLYFVATDGTSGRELWKTDGGEAETVRVADVNAGSADAFVSFERPALAALGGTILFVASDGSSGRELWRTDGTAPGTMPVADINPGAGDAFSSPELFVAGGMVFFAADDGTNGQEPWRSDGTGAGTMRIKDIHPGPDASLPRGFTSIGTTVLFVAYDASGLELWRSDGTDAGTARVKDINPTGSAFEFFPLTPMTFATVGGTLFFAADDGSSGRELWRSDGTESGTSRVKDIYAGADDSSPMVLTASSGQLVFFALDPSGGLEPWRSDGTDLGTMRLKDVNPGAGSSSMSVAAMIDVGGTIFFAGDDGQSGSELWKTDGTPAGTVRLKDVNPAPAGTAGSDPADLTPFGGALLFRANDGVSGNELWRSDGTPEGTRRVKDVNPGAAEGIAFFDNVATPDGALLFAADDGVTGRELWRTDGTDAGTVRVKDINPGPGSSYPLSLTDVGGAIFFAADDGQSGFELWRTDGTEAGTIRVRDIDPGAGGSVPADLMSALGALYFVADDGTSGRELWRSDGTEAGTVRVADIYPGAGDGFSAGPFFVDVGGTLFFRAGDGTSGRELWRTDGTESGTARVADIRPGFDSSSPSNLKNFGGTLFFVADDGTRGIELWKSDGTEAGTVLVKDVTPGPDGSFETFILVDAPALTPIGATLFFVATDGTHGFELWKTDGTESGSVLVKDIRPGSTGSAPLGLRVVHGALLFRADDGTAGRELWQSDGTEAGTVLLADLAPGTASSSPSKFTVVGDLVFFSADDGTGGLELWATSRAVATGLDWFACYKTKPTKGAAKFPKGITVLLDDGSGAGARTHAVRKPASFCAPASESGQGLFDPDTHLRAYRSTLARGQSKPAKQIHVGVMNELHATPLTLDAKPPNRLLVPSAADLDAPPPLPSLRQVDHFACRKVKISRGAPRFPKGLRIAFADQFARPKTYDVKKPSRLCAPVDQNATGITNREARLLCYRVKRAKGEPKHVKVRGMFVDNELAAERLDTVKEQELCVPSRIVF